MSSGKLNSVVLDDRTWQDITDEAKSLIPKYTSEWTDHNPSDLGIALIELFAWVSEQIIYRLNRVPDKNFVEFLNLIGVTRDPPTAAQAEITFKIAGDDVVTVAKSTQVSTPPSGVEDGVIFETDELLNAVNINKCLFLDNVGNSYTNISSDILEEPYDTVELVIPAGQDRILLFGIKTQTAVPLSFTFRMNEENLTLTPAWKFSTTLGPNSWPEVEPVANSEYAFDKSGRVSLRVPTNWQALRPDQWGAPPPEPTADDQRVDEALYWIAVSLSNSGGSQVSIHLNRVAGNIISATNTNTVREELLGVSDGKPFQVFQLRNTPLYMDNAAVDPLEHLVIQVQDEADVWIPWQRVEDFNQENTPHYLFNPVTGELSFGNFPTGDEDNPGYGRIPAEGRQIKAHTYRYVAGGSNGNVPANVIKVQRTPVPGVTAVTNELAAYGGTDWEAVEDTKRRGPQAIKVRDTAVTVEDFEFLAKRATTDVAKVRCLPPKKRTPTEWITTPLERTPGKVNLIILPNDTARRPVPTTEVINDVKSFLDERRTITSILIQPSPPFYVEVSIAATVFVKPGLNETAVKQEIQQKLFDFLHPVTGGPNQKGWEIGQDLYIPDVFTILDSISSISYIEALTVGGASGVRLGIEEHQLICASELNDTNYAITVNEEELEP